MSDLRALERVLTRTKRRARLQRACEGAALAAVVALGVAGIAHGFLRVTALPPAAPLEGLGVLAAIVLATLAGLLWPLDSARVAHALDHAHGFHDRVRSALEFRALPAPNAFMRAHLRDVEARASGLSPQRAAPLHAPRSLRLLPLAGLAWLLALALPQPAPAKQPHDAPVRATLLEADELEAFRDELAALSSTGALMPLAEEDARAYNALLEKLGTGELSRAEALAALLSLERKLLSNQNDSASTDALQLREWANDLAKASETTAKALATLDAEQAARELAELGKQVAQQNAAERAELARALARERARREKQDAAREREQELDRLLRDRDARKSADAGEKSLFDRRKRELERLRREREAADKRHRELSRLSRDLADASNALSQNQQADAADALQRGAEDLHRFAQNKLDAEQQKQLARQVSQLRELLQRERSQSGKRQQQQQQQQQQSQSGQGQGQARQQRVQRFVLRARGQNPDQDQQQQTLRLPGAPGQPDAPKGGSGESQDPNGSPEQGDPKGQGKPGETQLQLGGQGGQEAVLELPGLSQQRIVSPGGAGTEHDPRRLDNPTDLDAKHRDSQLTGSPGKGPTRSQVILDAADRGFATATYKKTYTDYRSHAEDVLERDEIPSGHRFYVRRYFQLIRPRDE